MGFTISRGVGPWWGAKFSPSLANLFMGWWERSLIFGDGNLFRSLIVLYFRYIDDLIFICRKDVDLTSFLLYLNDNQCNLGFTGISDSRAVSFLDVLLSGDIHKVSTQLYRKPLAGNSLLLAGSSHPHHKRYSSGTVSRLHRICSTQLYFEREPSLMYQRFLERGYPRWSLDRAYSIALNKNRHELFHNRNTQKKDQ